MNEKVRHALVVLEVALALAVTSCAVLDGDPIASMTPRPLVTPAATMTPTSEPNLLPAKVLPTAPASLDDLCHIVDKEGIVAALVAIDKKNPNGVNEYTRVYAANAVDSRVVILRDGACFDFSRTALLNGTESTVVPANQPFFADNGFITHKGDEICQFGGTDAVSLAQSRCLNPANR